MKVKATNTIIDWDAEAGQMVIINAGETGSLSETMRKKHEGSWDPAADDADGTEILGALVDENGNAIDVPDGDLSDPPAALDITDGERANLPQLDHDNDGTPGGSTTPEHSDDLVALRARYKEVVGKNYFAGWDAAELQKRIDAHLQEQGNDGSPGGSEDGTGEGAEDDAPAA